MSYNLFFLRPIREPKKIMISAIKSSAKQLWNSIARMIPLSDKWEKIFVAFCYLYGVAAIVIYFLGIENFWATKIVYYMWKLNPLGILWGDVPYTCAPVGSMAESDICVTGLGADGLDMSHSSYGYGFHDSFFFFVFGGVLSVRILAFCLDKLEGAMGIDFLSRFIEKFLPGKRSTD